VPRGKNGRIRNDGDLALGAGREQSVARTVVANGEMGPPFERPPDAPFLRLAQVERRSRRRPDDRATALELCAEAV
jgi:hypothetical protein